MRSLTKLFLTCALAAPALAQNPVYDYSDGDAEVGISQVANGTTLWVSEFDTNDFSNSSDEVVVAASARFHAGASGGIAIYQDNAGTGNPIHLTGADLLGWRTWKLSDASSSYQEPVMFCPTLTVTGRFFVVAWAAHNNLQFPAPVDVETLANTRQFIGGHLGSFDPTNPDAIDFPFTTYVGGTFVMSAGRPVDIIHVDVDAAGDGDGTSWADAYNSMQDALCIARSGDQVWVAEGTYLPDDGILHTPGNQCEYFALENEVEFYGGFDASEGSLSERDVAAYASILSGDLGDDDAPDFVNYSENSEVVVRALDGIDDTAVLDGFTVRGGNAISGGCSGDRGGAMKISTASPTVRWNTFRENFANVGGAVATGGSSSPTFEDCTFEDNESEYDGGAVAATTGVTPSFLRCIFQNNSGRNGGAVVLADGSVDAYFESCEFLNNKANESSSSGEGGAIDYRFGDHESATVVNCTFDGNRAYKGGAIFQGGELTVINSTFNKNVATTTGGGILEDGSSNTDITNSILYNNSDQSGETSGAQVTEVNNLTVSYSCIEAWASGGTANTSDDPEFQNENAYNLRVQVSSPCKDTGDDSAVPAGVTEDLDGDNRFAGSAVDMGAYELTSSCGGSVSYCTSGTSASGCNALMSTTGTASATASSGFTLEASGVEGNKDGLFFFGSNGRQANSWGNGTSFQCVIPPVQRAGLLSGSGSNGQCNGAFSQDLNALWCPTCPKPAKNPGPGAVVQAQLWYRDPFSTASTTTSLSDAVEFVVCP